VTCHVLDIFHAFRTVPRQDHGSVLCYHNVVLYPNPHPQELRRQLWMLVTDVHPRLHGYDHPRSNFNIPRDEGRVVDVHPQIVRHVVRTKLISRL
jgi:hypothetical protein